MSINFEKIPSNEEINLNSLPKTRTVLEELNARQHLLNERTIKCGDIRPFYVKTKRPAHQYLYQYKCICPSSKPQYECKHTGNIIIDRDVLTPEEHIVYLARPKANLAAPRLMPRYFVKRSIVANCTARIMRLAKPDKKQVSDTLNNFHNIISRRHKRSLEKCLEATPKVEYTTIKAALDLIREEKRLKKVAKRKERLRCERLRRKIDRKQKRQIRKIVCILFEEMKEFLLNDQFNHDETPLGEVILEAIKEFTDKEFHMTRSLRDYQKTLAYNLAIWINKFLSNLNIHVAENAPQDMQTTQSLLEQPKKDLTTFLPLDDYILQKGEKTPENSQVSQKSSQMSQDATEKPEQVRETEQYFKEESSLLSSPYVIISHSNMQLADVADENLQIPQNLTVDNILLHSSSSSDDFYFSARSVRQNK